MLNMTIITMMHAVYNHMRSVIPWSIPYMCMYFSMQFECTCYETVTSY